MAKTGSPPDGGYGWVIVAVSFTLNILGFAAVSTYGVMFEEFIEIFEISKTATSLFSMFALIAFSIAGFPFGACVAQFGYRTMVIGMTCITFTGFFTSYFVTDYRLLYFTYGFLPASATTLQIQVVVDIVGIEKAPGLTGVLFLHTGLAAMACGPLTGYIADMRDINLSFVAVGSLQVLGGFVICSSFIVGRYKKSKKNSDSQLAENEKGTEVVI